MSVILVRTVMIAYAWWSEAFSEIRYFYNIECSTSLSHHLA